MELACAGGPQLGIWGMCFSPSLPHGEDSPPPTSRFGIVSRAKRTAAAVARLGTGGAIAADESIASDMASEGSGIERGSPAGTELSEDKTVQPLPAAPPTPRPR